MIADQQDARLAITSVTVQLEAPNPEAAPMLVTTNLAVEARSILMGPVLVSAERALTGETIILNLSIQANINKLDCLLKKET